MKRGRKPTPTDIKLAKGNPGKRKLNASEPRPGSSLPLAPDDLTQGERKIWQERARVDSPLGVLTDADLDLAKRAAQVTHAADLFHAALIFAHSPKGLEEPLRGIGQVLLESMGSLRVVAREFRAYANLERLMLAELGRTPSARSSIKVPGKGIVDPNARERAAVLPLRAIPGGKH